MTSMKCSKCNRKVTAAAASCTNCGTPVTGSRQHIEDIDPSIIFLGAILLFFLLLTILLIIRIPFPNNFDEAAHLSYIIDLADKNLFFPDFHDFPMRYGDAQTIYLNHPPFYYLTMGIFERWLSPLSSIDILILRSINLLLVYTAVLLSLLVCLTTHWNKRSRVAFIFLIVMIPNLSVIAITINNDNMAILGGSMVILGAMKIMSRNPNGYLVGSIGFMLAAVSKFTAFLLMTLFTFPLLIVLWLLKYSPPKKPAWHWIALFFFLAATPYFYFWFLYGSPVPTTPGHLEIIESLAASRGWSDIRYSFSEYFFHFFKMLALNWPIVPLTGDIGVYTTGLYGLIFVLGIVLSTVKCLNRSHKPIDVIIVCGAISILATLAIHFVFNYIRHSQTGWMSGIHPRYYFPLFPLLPAACANLINEIKSPLVSASALVVIAMIATISFF